MRELRFSSNGDPLASHPSSVEHVFDSGVRQKLRITARILVIGLGAKRLVRPTWGNHRRMRERANVTARHRACGRARRVDSFEPSTHCTRGTPPPPRWSSPANAAIKPSRSRWRWTGSTSAGHRCCAERWEALQDEKRNHSRRKFLVD
jgi:hypothetical protein